MKRSYFLWYIDEFIEKIRDKENREYYLHRLQNHVRDMRDCLIDGISDFKQIGEDTLRVLSDKVPENKEEIISYMERTGKIFTEKESLFSNLISISCPSDFFIFLDYYINKEVPSMVSSVVKRESALIAGIQFKSNPLLTEQFIKTNKSHKENVERDLKEFYNLKKEEKLFVTKNKEQEKFINYFKGKLLNYREEEILSTIEQCSEIELYFEDRTDNTHLDKAINLLYKATCNRMRFEILMKKFNQYDKETVTESYLTIGYPFSKDSSLKEELEKANKKSEIMSLIPFFNLLSEAEIQRLSSRIKLKRHNGNSLIFKEGDRADEFYIVKSGNITIYNSIRDFVTLVKGDMFGELGVILDKGRTLSARVSSDKAEVYVISRSDFLYMLKNYPRLSMNLSQVLCKRLDQANVRLINYLKDYSIYSKEKMLHINRKTELIGEIPLFNVLSVEQTQKLSSRIKLRKYDWGTLLFNEGDTAQEVYIIKSGEINIYKMLDSVENIRDFVTLTKGDVFGEMGVISNSPRILSAKVSSLKAELYVISKNDFLYMMDNYPDLSLNLVRLLCERIDNNTNRLLNIIKS